jgi:two-component system, LytTR family, response regulator LytT
MENEIHILIVEDEALIAHNLKMQLEDFGYNIANVCYNYEAALTAIANNDFDVLLTDINLGNGIDEKSGLQLVTHLQQTKACPVIFLTAFSDKETIKKAAAFSPSAYLVKPINEANLFAAIQVAVENFSTQQASTQVPQNETLNYFFVKQGNKLIKIQWQDVYHLEATKNYVKIVTTHIPTGVMVRGSLINVYQKMMPKEYCSKFAQISRSTCLKKDTILKIVDKIAFTAFGNFEATNQIDLDNR